jgi:hypothetical protein
LGVFLLLTYAFTHKWPVPDTASVLELLQQMVADYSHGEKIGLSNLSRLPHKSLLGFSKETSLFQPWSEEVWRGLVLQIMGRSLFTTVLIADLFVSVNSAMWRHGKRVAADPASGGYDRLMGSLERILNKS